MGTDQVDDRRSASRRRWGRWMLAVPLLFAASSALQVMVLRVVDPPISAAMLARHVEAWSQGDWQFDLHWQWCDLDAISPNLQIAAVAAEDQRFPFHHGFDIQAIEQAREHNAAGGRVRGASTISQQVAKNLFLWQGRSWLRKGLEAWYTLLIELFWSKHRILEMYLNIAEFGDGVYGAEAAAQQFWNKDARSLTLAESSCLAAVLPSPRRYDARRPSAYVQMRSDWIQRQVKHLGGPDYLRVKR